jgi:hypothetical protein
VLLNDARKPIGDMSLLEYGVSANSTGIDTFTSRRSPELFQFEGKYTALLAILIVGSFVIPMAQYFWYVRDDDSTDKFFAQQVPEPKAPPKKKGWF